MSEMYPYATGDLIETPNTYFYTVFGGQPFVDAWRRTRDDVQASLPSPANPPPAFMADDQSRDSADLLERAFAGDEELREAFRRKFEITKRVHGGYDDQFRAIDRYDRRDLGRYMRAADIFELAYVEHGSVRYLNVLLKCIDTLCASSDQLGADLKSRLAWHLAREREHFQALSAQVR